MKEKIKPDKTIGEIWDTLNEDQKKMVYYIAGISVEEKVIKLTKENDRLKAKVELLNARLERQKKKYEKKIDSIVKLCDSLKL